MQSITRKRKHADEVQIAGGGNAEPHTPASKCPRIIDWKLLLFAALLTVALYVIAFLTQQIVYFSNDDERIQSVLSGYWTGSPYPYHQFIHVILSHMIAGLYTLLPNIQWWFVYSEGLMAIGITITNYALLRVAKKTKVAWFVLAAFLALLYAAFYIESIGNVAFTIVPAVFGTGLIVLLFSMEPSASVKVEADSEKDVAASNGAAKISFVKKRISRKSICVWIAAFAVYFLMYIHRAASGMAALCFLMLGLFWYFLSMSKKWWHALIRVAVAGCLFFAVTTVLGNLNSTAQLAENGKDFMSFNSARAAYMDYAHDAYEDNPQIYEDVGWDWDTYALVSGWCFLDEDVTAESLSYLSANSTVTAESKSETMQTLLDNLMQEQGSRGVWFAWVASAGACVLAAWFARRNKELVFGLLNNVGAGALIAYQFYMGRIVYRSMFVVLMPAFAINLILILRSWQGLEEKKTFVGGCLAALTLCCLIPACMSVFDQEYQAEVAEEKQRTTEIFQYFEEHPDNFYVTQFMVTDRLDPLLTLSGISNNIQWGGSMYGSRAGEMLLAANGISELTGEVFKRDDVYLVALVDMMNEDVKGDAYSYYMLEWFSRWLGNEYDAIGFVEEDVITDTVGVYHFVFEENAENYDYYYGIEWADE